MTNASKSFLSTVILLTVICFAIKAQTNVSGGIYSNTTWTKANSPYVVTDTVVVFPNVTLTIEPGVTVKFADHKRIEIRQAQLIANGTRTDSITFTSNSLSPIAGIYPGIYLNGGSLTSIFNYCNFSYATISIKVTVADSVIVNNSDFYLDSIGFQFIGSRYGVALIDSSIFKNNTNGLILEDVGVSTINYCDFSYNRSDGFILGNPSEASNFLSTTNYCNFSNNGIGLLLSMLTSTISYCNFSKNNTGLQGGSGAVDNDFSADNTVNNCVFDFNQTGLGQIDQVLIDGCTIIQNQTGYQGGISKIENCIVDSNSVTGLSSSGDSVINCKVRYNGTGIQTNGSFILIIGNDIEFNTAANISSNSTRVTITGNTIRYGNIGIEVDNYYNSTSFLITDNLIDYNDSGVILNASNGTFSCNNICNNTTYDLTYSASSDLDASHNYWCTFDSASIAATIYDGHDNINYGLVSFMPLDTIGCDLPTGISINKPANLSFNIFPNPAFNNLTLFLAENTSRATIKIFNLLGEVNYAATVTKQRTEIDVSALASGVYILEISCRDILNRQKFIKE